jgi:hypothetical protein
VSSLHTILGQDVRCRVIQVVSETQTAVVVRTSPGAEDLLGATYHLRRTAPTAAPEGGLTAAIWNTGPVVRGSILAIPLKKSGDVLGVLTIDSLTPRAFSASWEEALEPFVDLLSLILSTLKEVPEDVVRAVEELRESSVLVLGKDCGPEVARLKHISRALRAKGYRPRLVKEASDIPELSNEEKVRVFADLSRFVILENSYPAGQIAELKICATNRIVTATLREKGRGSSYMVTDYSKDFDFIQEFEFLSEDEIPAAVDEATTWAESKLEERRSYYDERYPWRKR